MKNTLIKPRPLKVILLYPNIQTGYIILQISVLNNLAALVLLIIITHTQLQLPIRNNPAKRFGTVQRDPEWCSNIVEQQHIR